MTIRPSLDEFISHRKDYVDDNGVLYKGAVTSEKRYDDEKRCARFIMSSEASDRMSDVVKQQGIDLTNFMKNPIGLAYHRHDSPIGMWKNVEVITNGRPARTEGDLFLHEEGVTEMADEIGRLLSVGGLKAVSIGFIPKEIDYIRDKDGVWTGGFSIPESELLECSVVSIPAQPAALMKAAGGNAPLVAEALEYILDTYCEKTSGGLFVRKEFEQAYAEMKDRSGAKAKQRRAEDAMVKELSIAVDVDLQEAEKKVDGLLEKLRKGMGEIFGMQAHEEPGGGTGTEREKAGDTATSRPSLVFTVDESGDIHVKEWLEKTLANKELVDAEKDLAIDDDGCIMFKTADQTAKYKVVNDDGRTLHLDLVEVKDIEPEPQAPVLVKGSRAQADARIAKLKASLIESGALS